MNIYRVGDLLPPLTIYVRDEGTVVDLSTMKVWVRWRKGDGTELAEREATIVDATTGEAQYDWIEDDLDVVGTYEAIIQLSPTTDDTVRYSLMNPPVTEIEVLSNDFETVDNSFALVPTPSLSLIASLMGQDLADLDGNRLRLTVQRARRSAWAYVGLSNCVGTFGEEENSLLNDLVALLAARDYMTSPSITYGPYKKETIGSYDYELWGPTKIDPNTPWAITGNQDIDSILGYFYEFCRGGAASIDILYPDWWQPITTRIENPAPYAPSWE